MTTKRLRSLTLTQARRLAVARQRLDDWRDAPPDAPLLLDIIRQIGCLQLDPISAVARSHLLVLWSRAGGYRRDDLDRLLWETRELFEYWAHAASIVLTEDYPFHLAMMQAYRDGATPSSQRTRAWAEANNDLRRHILDSVRAEGPLPSRYFEDRAKTEWYSTGWTNGRNAGQMIDYLWISGVLMVAARKGGQKYWDLAERCLPAWTPREPLPDDERVRLAAGRALRALGVATPAHIGQHFLRGRYPGLQGALDDLERSGEIERVVIEDDGRALPGVWYLHRDDVPLLDSLDGAGWRPRTTLLSPFDNLICDRKRTRALFNFDFTIEIYVPKAKRRFGYYVLPILHGDRLIGRIDPLLDRKTRRLHINAVYREADAPDDAETGRAVASAIANLAEFLGASAIDYLSPPPSWWRLTG